MINVLQVVEIPFEEVSLVFTDACLYIVRFTNESPVAEASLKTSSLKIEKLCKDQVNLKSNISKSCDKTMI